MTAEEFLRDKLESEISSFGDGTTEFHTRDIEHLLKCLDEKDEKISKLLQVIDDLDHKLEISKQQERERVIEMLESKIKDKFIEKQLIEDGFTKSDYSTEGFWYISKDNSNERNIEAYFEMMIEDLIELIKQLK